MNFRLKLKPPTTSRVVERFLTFQIGNTETVTDRFRPEDYEAPLQVGKEGDLVAGMLIDIDDEGCESPAQCFAFLLTAKPPKPLEVEIELS